MEDTLLVSDAELRLSPRLVAGALVVLALISYWSGDWALNPRRTVLLDLVLVCLGLAGTIIVMDGWSRPLGAWSSVVGVSVLIVLGTVWLDQPAMLVLMGLGTVLAAALLGLRASALTALGQTVVLWLAGCLGWFGASGTLVSIAVGSVWGALALAIAIYRPVYGRSAMLRRFYAEAHQALEESRQRQAEMEAALIQAANANRQLAIANERIAALRLIAEDAQKTKTTFVAKVSHELRTPLNMIIGLVQLIAEKPEIYALDPSPELEEALEVILRNCRHLTGLINDVLDLTRMESGRLTLHKERVDLGEIVAEAVTAVRPLADSKRLTLRVERPQELPAVLCDRTRIRQVVLNLLSNAARFTEHGGITVRIIPRERSVLVEVADTGPGIGPEDAARIFEPFCQGADAIWRDRGGSGLGLSISQQFVKLHGGRLWLESELGAGSQFFFELPISPPVEQVPAASSRWIRGDWVWREESFRTEQAGLAAQPARPRLVLYDETGGLGPELARFESEIELCQATQLDAALEEARRHLANVLVVNTAAVQQVVGLLEEARREAPTVPVVGCSVPNPVRTAAAAGAAGYVVKPVTRADLARVLGAAGRPVRRVLVVDDDADALALFARMLRACDERLEIETASSGESALEAAACRRFDLVLLDIVMPGMDGWAVLERLRNMGDGDRPLVYFVSAQDLAARPAASDAVIASIGEGISVVKLLRLALEAATLLLTPDGALDPVPR